MPATPAETFVGTDYNFVARFYDGLSHLYSGGQIRACKQSQLAQLGAGDKVLYAGVGGGEDAALASRRGAQVTVVDLAPRMLERAAQRFANAGVQGQVEVICGNILLHQRCAYYDVVVANFFLNVFAEAAMKSMLAHLAGLVRPGGKLLIADFAPQTGSLAQRVYWNMALYAFNLLANNALHEIYDYSQYFAPLHLKLEQTQDFKLFRVGPPWYRTLTATRSTAERDRSAET